MRAPFLQISGLITKLFLLFLFSKPAMVLAVEMKSQIVSHANQNESELLRSVRENVLEKAKKQALSKHETWLALLHYKKMTISGEVLSQADDPKFFLHPDGKTDAGAELEANIYAFFKQAHSGHAQCLFPARWWWLKQQLDLASDYDVSCPKLDAFIDRISADKLFLVFPTMYLNNPGSTFGHTFLRFDTNDKSTLLSQTLNYAARTDKSDNILNYVRKGLFGGYTGFFRMRSYFETVQEYNNIENRDIWEYELAFTKSEIEQLLRHIWEINDIDFDYFFLKENCAYRLLALMDVMRAGMSLTTEGKFPVYAIPVDTVRALDEMDLIKSRKLRASLVTQIDDYIQNNDRYNSIAVDIATKGNINNTESILNTLNVVGDENEKINILQQSYNILQFNNASSSRKSKNILQLINSLKNKDNKKAIENIQQNDLAQNKVSVPEKNTNYGKVAPEKGHNSIRVSVGVGEQNSHQYIDMQFRPSFHDLMDSSNGYVMGAAINTFEARFKWFISSDNSNENRNSQLRLESLRFFNITSLNPIRSWHKPLSWLIDIRLDRTQISKRESLRNFLGRGGVGLSFRKKHFLPFVMLLGEGNLSSDYQKGYSVLLGLQAGLQLNFKSNRLMLSYQNDEAVSGFELNRRVSDLQWQYDLQVNHAVRLRYRRSDYDFFDDEDWSLNYLYYF